MPDLMRKRWLSAIMGYWDSYLRAQDNQVEEQPIVPAIKLSAGYFDSSPHVVCQGCALLQCMTLTK